VPTRSVTLHSFLVLQAVEKAQQSIVRLEAFWASVGRRRFGDPIVAVLTNQVRDAHLAGLREDGFSYIFAGARELDLNLALEVLNYELALR
jgi:hypothetical protein